jgi:hypothetical protein
MRTLYSFLTVFLLLVSSVTVTAGSENQSFYGQTLPGQEPIKFAPEVLASDYHLHGALNFSPDGKAIYWSVMTGEGMKSTVCVSAFDGKLLAKPVIAPFATTRSFAGAAISPDGKRMFFSGSLPLKGDTSKKAMAIFCAERVDTGWSKPIPIESTIDTLINKGQVSVARSGNIYFGGRVLAERTPAIFLCRYNEGRYSPPEKLAGAIAALPLAADPWLDPDERFMLLSCPPLEGPPMLTDIGVSIRQVDGTWNAPVRIGGTVNMPDAFERFPSLSPDAKYLFFIRSVGQQFIGGQASFYWVEASILDSLKESK